MCCLMLVDERYDKDLGAIVGDSSDEKSMASDIGVEKVSFRCRTDYFGKLSYVRA